MDLVWAFNRLVMRAGMSVVFHPWRLLRLAPNIGCCGSEYKVIVQCLGMIFRMPEHVDRGRISVGGDVSPALHGQHCYCPI